ncbi:MAG: glycoside hydrolase family 9 protein [Candidatus Solibacter sp.]
MKRRSFLGWGLASPAAALLAQTGPPREEAVESMMPDEAPAIALNHLGFLPGARKKVIFRYSGDEGPAEFQIRDIGNGPGAIRKKLPLKRDTSDVIDCLVGDFSEITREGMYQVSIADELSTPFFIRPDVWRRTLPKVAGYYRYQRCGVAVPGVHPACHLDDARRRDNGERVDTTGGWHDAGDLRKWMDATMLNAIGLLRVARNPGAEWDAAAGGVAPLLEEVRWGNRYFLKMQDADGLVWADVAGGLNGDNSDNHWTDNRPGTDDDRYLNPAKRGRNQAMFIVVQAMAAQAFKAGDAAYAKQCLTAAQRCWTASQREGGSGELAWWVLAALEMRAATGSEAHTAEAVRAGSALLALQSTEFVGAQKEIRGYWRVSDRDRNPYTDAVHSALPPLALLELARALPEHANAKHWRDALRMHLEEYVLPMASHSAYGIVPFGVFMGSPTVETYRPLAGEMTYRYFMPVRKQFWWLGMTSHLECYALMLGQAAHVFGRVEYRDLAYRQLEWVMGANPFGACLMTGEGMRNPYPHSRFVGLIPGGIMNGIAGNAKDAPILDMQNGFDWRTTEYWSPHNAFYLWAVSTL